MADNEDLDRLLEEGIQSYIAAEPLAGLEQRVLARTRIQPKRNRTVATLTAAVACAGTVILAIAFHTSRDPAPVSSVAAVHIAASHPITASSPKPVLVSQRRRSRYRLPKQAQFPTPQPVTPEEHLLLALIAAHPDQTAEAFASLRTQSDPIEIKPIEIKPLGQAEKDKGGE